MIDLPTFLRIAAILQSLDGVPGIPIPDYLKDMPKDVARRTVLDQFRGDPLGFLRRADEPIRAVIWAAAMKRLALPPRPHPLAVLLELVDQHDNGLLGVSPVCWDRAREATLHGEAGNA